MFKRSTFLFLFPLILFAQQPEKLNSVEIYNKIQKLNFLGSVLYVAAHPDDENTRLISYFENEIHARTAYISLTRGDGGQNLIGPELRELLGVIRTEELMEARKIDGGEQFFTSANDFGFSKHPDETFNIWDKTKVLEDLVFVIRTFKPDVIINRFDHRTAGSTHGHHTASAILSEEAFDLVNKKDIFPNQLDLVETWQPKRLFYNTSWWFYGSREKFEEADKSNLISVDTGVYFSELGLSNSEIASLSRSQHKSQGFGNTGTRGIELEYLELIKGKKAEKNVFEGIDTSWNRVKGGKSIGEILAKVEQNFNFSNPSASVSDLLKALQLIENMEDEHWSRIKSAEIKEIIAACLGLYLEVVAEKPLSSRGEEIKLNFETINRSNQNVKIISVEAPNFQSEKNLILTDNQDFQWKDSIKIPENHWFSSPYWLQEKGSVGMYEIPSLEFTGLPQTPTPIQFDFNLLIDNQPITFRKNLVYKKNDPVDGEIYKPFSIIPSAAVDINEKVNIFGKSETKEIVVSVKSFKENLMGNLSLKTGENWKISPLNQKVEITGNGQLKNYVFTVQSPNNSSEVELMPELQLNDEIITKNLVEINYNHIPELWIQMPGSSKLIQMDIKTGNEKVGYIMGAGDEIPKYLKQLGFNIEIIEPQFINPTYLESFNTIILGIRAFNTVEELKLKNQILFDFVKEGGNLIVQYNTNRGLVTEEIAPFEIELSRDRVTDENSPVEFVNSQEIALNFPNKITQQDFEGWTQERGLYFPGKWGKEFRTVLKMNDPNEPTLESSLLIAKHGKGNYVYTGLSFFRELPEGVAGAYKLMANLISLPKNQ